MTTDDSSAGGYKRPPTANRFKPGKSGNPKGRPRNSKNLRTVVATELDRKVRGTIGGKPATMSTLEFMIYDLAQAARLGDRKARADLLALRAALNFDDQFAPVVSNALSANDVSIIERLLGGDDAQSGDARSGDAEENQTVSPPEADGSTRE